MSLRKPASKETKSLRMMCFTAMALDRTAIEA